MVITGHEQCRCILCENGEGINDVVTYAPDYGTADVCDTSGRATYSYRVAGPERLITGRTKGAP